MNTVSNKLALVPAGSLLTINGQAYDESVTLAHNNIVEQLNTQSKPGDFIQSKWVEVTPVAAIAEMAVNRLKAGLPVPTILAKALNADKESKKLLVAARKERKQFILKHQRTIVSNLIDNGFNLGKVDTSKAIKPDGKGNMHVDIRFTKGATPEVTEDDKKAVLDSLSADQLRKLLAAAEAKAKKDGLTIDLTASSPATVSEETNA